MRAHRSMTVKEKMEFVGVFVGVVLATLAVLHLALWLLAPAMFSWAVAAFTAALTLGAGALALGVLDLRVEVGA